MSKTTWYKHFERLISEGGDLTKTLMRIDEYHIMGRLSDADRDELVQLARDRAQPALELAQEVQRLWAAIGNLREEIAMLKAGGTTGSTDGDIVQDGVEELDIPDFVAPTGAHDAYYAGALVCWEGKVYVCTAPEGVACVWSPEVMPGYWDELTISEEVGGDG